MRDGLARFGARALLVMALRAAAAVLAYAVVVLFSRWLTVEDYGHYATIMSGVTLGAVLCRFGTDVAILRFLGEYRAAGRPDLANGAIEMAQRAVLGAGLMLGLVAVVVIVLRGDVAQPIAYGVGAMLILPAFAMSDLQGAILRARGRIFAAIAPRDLIWRAVAIVVGVVFIGLGYGSRNWLLPALLLTSGAVLGGLVVGQYRLQSRLRPPEAPTRDFARWRRSAGAIWLSQIARVSFRTVDVLMVSFMLSIEAAGLYFIASRTAELMGFLLAALNLVVGPAIAKSHAAGEIGVLRRRLALVSLILVATGLPVLGICLFAGEWILALAGSQVITAAPALAILALGQFANLAAGSAGITLNMTGHEGLNARILIGTAFGTLILLAVLTPTWGMIGAATASSIGMTISNGLIWRAVRRHTPYDPSLLGIRYLWRRT